MKKMIMMMAIMVVASVSHAASISWGNASTAAIYDLTGTTKLTLTAATAANMVVQLINVTDGNVVAQTLPAGSTINNMTAGVLASGTFLNYTWTSASVNDVYKVVLSATFGGTAYTMTIENAAWKIAATDNGGTDTFTWTSGTNGGTGTGNNVRVAVPEPTSMALLALGVAAVGFRCRFRK